MEVVEAIDAAIARTSAELDRLKLARAVLVGDAAKVLPVSTSAIAALPAPKPKPGPKPGNGSRPGRKSERPAGLSVPELRGKIASLLTRVGQATPKRMAESLGVAKWRMSEVLKDWPDVEHTVPGNMKSPYQLTTAAKSARASEPSTTAAPGPT